MIKDYTERNKRIIKDYQSGLRIRQVSDIYNLSESQISWILARNNIKTRPASEGRRRYYANDNYFDNIDTEAKAYFLGLLYADGCNYQTLRGFFIGLHIKDMEILTKFKQSISFTGEIKLRKNKLFATIDIHNNTLSQRLNELGVVPRKSLVLTYPSFIPFHLEHHFIRGYFDGDGCIYNRINSADFSMLGTEHFLNGVLTALLKVINTKTKVRLQDKRGHIYTLFIGGNKQIEKIRDYLYKDATLYLERKKTIFDAVQHVSWYK